METFLRKAKMNAAFAENAAVIGAIKQCLESARYL